MRGSRPRQNDPSTIRVGGPHAPAVLAERDGERTLGPEEQLAHVVLIEEVAPSGPKPDKRAVVREYAAEIRHVAPVYEHGTLRQIEDEVATPVVLVEENAAVLAQRHERGGRIGALVRMDRSGERARDRRDDEHKGDGYADGRGQLESSRGLHEPG